MIDIHTHILPFVDDGCNSFEQAIKMLKSLTIEGVNNVILTPHLRGEYNSSVSDLTKIFNELKEKVAQQKIDIGLFLGEEVFASSENIERLLENNALTLNNSKYVLIEFPYYDMIDVKNSVYQLVSGGYIPIVAHIERYPYLTLKDFILLKDMGALFQVNAYSISEEEVLKNKTIKKLFSKNLIDFVSSDFHSGREPKLKEAYKIISKKYGEERAELLFNNTKEKII